MPGGQRRDRAAAAGCWGRCGSTDGRCVRLRWAQGCGGVGERVCAQEGGHGISACSRLCKWGSSLPVSHLITVTALILHAVSHHPALRLLQAGSVFCGHSTHSTHASCCWSLMPPPRRVHAGDGVRHAAVSDSHLPAVHLLLEQALLSCRWCPTSPHPIPPLAAGPGHLFSLPPPRVAHVMVCAPSTQQWHTATFPSSSHCRYRQSYCRWRPTTPTQASGCWRSWHVLFPLVLCAQVMACAQFTQQCHTATSLSPSCC